MSDVRKDEEVTLTLGQLSVLVKQAQEEEREACAKVCENMERNGNWITKEEAAAAIRARRIDLAKVGEVGVWGEKPWVKTYAGGKPNYTTPVDAVSTSQECVDETAKVKYMDMSQFAAETPNWKPGMVFPKPEREWVGLTHEEQDEIDQNCRSQMEAMFAVEATLKEKNT